MSRPILVNHLDDDNNTVCASIGWFIKEDETTITMSDTILGLGEKDGGSVKTAFVIKKSKIIDTTLLAGANVKKDSVTPH
jgi:hypothetical protein